MDRKKRTDGFKQLGVLLPNLVLEEDKYISREFQQYGYELAQELSDMKHKALYIKLAKTEARVHLEAARRFVKDAPNVRSRGRLFMWKLSELKAKKSEIQSEAKSDV